MSIPLVCQPWSVGQRAEATRHTSRLLHLQLQLFLCIMISTDPHKRRVKVVLLRLSVQVNVLCLVSL